MKQDAPAGEACRGVSGRDVHKSSGEDNLLKPRSNKKPAEKQGNSTVSGIAGERLLSFIERIERLEEEKAATATDIKEVYAEAKGSGLDTAIIRLLIKERRRDADDLDEERILLDVYRRALGMLADTPLGEAAVNRASGRVAKPHKLAHATGLSDGQDGERRYADKYPSGTYGHADYEIGYAEGEEIRARIRGLGPLRGGDVAAGAEASA